MKVAGVGPVLLLASWLLTCGPEISYHLGFEQGVSSRSPDGRYLAYVENHLSIDPPNQSLRLASTERSLAAAWNHVKLRQLGEDSESCTAIAWSPSGRHVAFVINESQVVTYEARSARLVGEIDLVDRDGYPTTRMVLGLRFESDGSRLSYLDCHRRSREDCRTRTVELTLEQASL